MPWKRYFREPGATVDLAARQQPGQKGGGSRAGFGSAQQHRDGGQGSRCAGDAASPRRTARDAHGSDGERILRPDQEDRRIAREGPPLDPFGRLPRDTRFGEAIEDRGQVCPLMSQLARGSEVSPGVHDPPGDGAARRGCR